MTALEAHLFYFLNEWGLGYTEAMAMPVSRRWRLFNLQDEKNRQEIARMKAKQKK